MGIIIGLVLKHETLTDEVHPIIPNIYQPTKTKAGQRCFLRYLQNLGEVFYHVYIETLCIEVRWSSEICTS